MTAEDVIRYDERPDDGRGGKVVPMRLQKFLARAGVASRRSSENLMTAGRVTVNGQVVSELGFKVDPLVDVVAVDGDFEEGDLVNILREDGTPLGVGRTSYGSTEARQLMGRHDQRPIIHYDYLYLE